MTNTKVQSLIHRTSSSSSVQFDDDTENSQVPTVAGVRVEHLSDDGNPSTTTNEAMSNFHKDVYRSK
eukprot:CAMPEP_0198131066 /NCGR_PEP_ID=MMETSP1442-20131203/55310_1 /TAXON_ID= /ORGANISM="Craspedostauros australis, Strain CCMP3328" /LENGTH=66 /DNA_ID=CAMNT_0043791801 /DNA_START=24 /DNA_END=221 /DNA_ORIENTATION=-